MRDMDMIMTLANAPYLWLALGAMLLALEAFGASGIGFLFAGLAAIVTAILAHLGWAETVWTQTTWFFAATVGWAILLWVPMQRSKAQKDAGLDGFNNMVGDEVIVLEGGLQADKTGQVRWSGTTMKAKLVDGVSEQVEGATVLIQDVKGTVLLVAPANKEEK
ncbi:MAG: NfeD family protein [Rickettsiales bacterium]|nr:NfeD family protein [Rickettsiales bacterium]